MLYEFVANSLCTHSVIVAVIDIIKIITTIIITSTKKGYVHPLLLPPEGQEHIFHVLLGGEGAGC